MVKNLKFFRAYFRIPRKYKLEWCILLESDEKGTVTRLGVHLVGTDKAIDVAARYFVEIDGVSEVKYQMLPVVRKSKGDSYVYISSEMRIERPKTFIQDIYFRCIYSPELMECELL